MKHNDDRLLKEIAGRYAEADGARLKREAAELEESGFAYDTARLDRRVREGTRPRRKMPYRQVGLLVAACLVVALVAPRILNLARPDSSEPSQSAPMEPAPDSTETFEMIPLGFELPEAFTVVDEELDRERSIYYLEDARLDDVVITLQYTPDDPDYAGLTPIPIGEGLAYGLAGADYNLLCFEREGIYYELTCRHDINTLIGIGRAAL